MGRKGWGGVRGIRGFDIAASCTVSISGFLGFVLFLLPFSFFLFLADFLFPLLHVSLSVSSFCFPFFSFISFLPYFLFHLLRFSLSVASSWFSFFSLSYFFLTPFSIFLHISLSVSPFGFSSVSSFLSLLLCSLIFLSRPHIISTVF